MKAAARLQSVKDNWDAGRAELGPALAYNRKLWTILSTSATKPENPLPLPIKNNIANLGLFIFQRTIDIEIEPAPEKLGILVSINSNIAAGLAGRS